MPHFFGLNHEHRDLILEEMFLLMKHLHISYESFRAMPVAYRSWLIRRIGKDFKASEALDQYGLDTDTPISAKK